MKAHFLRSLAATLSFALAGPVWAQPVPTDETPITLLWSRSLGLGLVGLGCVPGGSYAFAAVDTCMLGESFVFRPGFEGVLSYDAASPDDPQFACFAENLTNGIDDVVKYGVGLVSEDWEYHERKRESAMGMGSPDLQGHIVDELRIYVSDVTCGPSRWHWSMRWEIWGQTDVGQPIVAIAPSAHAVYPHEPVSLIVLLDRADTARLDPGIGVIEPHDGQFEILVPEETTFTLTATNANGTEIRELTLVPQPPHVEFTTESTQIFAGDQASLSWTVEGATSVSIEPEVGDGLPAVGSALVSPMAERTTYTLHAVNATGISQDSLTLEWKRPEARLVSSPKSPFPGESSDLLVHVDGADTATLEPGFGSIEPTNQTFQVLIETTTTYVLTATNALGTTSDTLVVEQSAPRVSLKAAPEQPQAGESVVFDVKITGADTASLTPFFAEIPPVDGSYESEVTEPTTVVLAATNAAGTATRELKIAPLPIVRFTTDPVYVEPGKTTTVTWEVLPFAEVSIDPWGTLPNVGRRTVRPQRSMTFTLSADHEDVAQSAQATVFLGSADVSTIELHFSDQDLLPGSPSLVPGIPFSLYVHAVRPDAGVAGYEFSVEHSDCLQAYGYPLQPNTIDVGIGDDNWIVGLPECELDELFTPLVKYVIVAPDVDCLQTGEVRIRPSTPSSFDPPVPGYLTCGYGGQLREFLPFVTPPPLALATVGSPLPAWSITLRATPSASGVELQWGDVGFDPEWIRVLRFEGDAPPVEVVRLAAEQAADSRGWLDAVSPGTYRYQVLAGVGGTELASEIVESVAGESQVGITALLPNAPNPFNPSTEIRYQLASQATVHLDIFNAAGRRVRSEVLVRQPAGAHSWRWNGTAHDGTEVGSGVYYVRLQVHGKTYTRQVVLLR